MKNKAAKQKRTYPTTKTAKKVKESSLNIFYLPQNKTVIDTVKQMNGNNVERRSSYSDSLPFLNDLGITIDEQRQAIQFTSNDKELVHRWTPYIQGFSASFVQRQIDQSDGVELNPLLYFTAKVKGNSWNLSGVKLLGLLERISSSNRVEAPAFLESSEHFNAKVLKELEKNRGNIKDLDNLVHLRPIFNFLLEDN